jgi:NAD(P)-dependent dehydrogenase (short-subunit alcohol dehydrogenase family)
MSPESSKQTVLITGATDGLGKAAALLFAERGYRVFAAGRSAAKRAELDALAHDKNLPLESLEMDVCDDSSVTRAVAQVLERSGAIDVLINNAGMSYVATVEEMSMEDWKRQFETNVFGVIRVTQAVVPHMRERRGGRILMMSSVSGLVTPPTQGAYSGSKHALEGISNALRLEMYPFDVKVILIEPGYIVTNIQNVAVELTKAYQDKITTGPYARLYAGAWSGARTSRAKSGTTPQDCAQIMLEAVEARNPRARYGVTPTASLIKWAKRLLPDSAIDRIIRKRYGITHEM